MADEKYQGWTNRETWLVNLWLTNEQPHYEAARAVAHEAEDVHDAADALERLVDHLIDEWDLTGFGADLVNAALHRCDFAEIAGHFRAP